MVIKKSGNKKGACYIKELLWVVMSWVDLKEFSNIVIYIFLSVSKAFL